MHDYKLGLRMLVKYPGLTIAGGLALAIAIGVGASWYEISRDSLRPAIPLDEGHRIVEINMRNRLGEPSERRLLHEFTLWREHLKTIEDLAAYRTLASSATIDDRRIDLVRVAEITPSGFDVARVAPLLGRGLIAADETPGAPLVAVLGHELWQQSFDGRLDAIGRTLLVGRTPATVVGVMPEGFAFPVDHQLWIPLQVPSSGFAPLEGPPIELFGRLAPTATHARALAELTTFTAQAAAASPRTHTDFRPMILAYGSALPPDQSLLGLAASHLPVLFVLIVACANVGTLVYARTAMRESEIAMRFALGASRGRIVAQLFVEALVLASLAAVAGLAAAHSALRWGMTTYYNELFARDPGAGLPFWIEPGLTLSSVLYAAGLVVCGAAMLSVLPALKATSGRLESHMRHAGAGGSTLRFGRLWTAVMIGQVAVTVILLPMAMEGASEAFRDRVIRSRFPGNTYLTVRLELDESIGAARTDEDTAPEASRRRRLYEEFAQRVAAEPGVMAVGFADRLPGLGAAVPRAEVETSPGQAPRPIANLWTKKAGPGLFEAFERPILSGRDFNDGDRSGEARTVIVNEAFVRWFMDGSNPIGRRLRYVTADQGDPGPWLEIVGVIRDIGLTPTDRGEAAYAFLPFAVEALDPVSFGIRVDRDAAAVAPRVYSIAAALDPALRLTEVSSLDRATMQYDLPFMVISGAFIIVVALGTFLSAAGIFSLMSVSVARRTREIGLRTALGASAGRMLAGIFSRALVLVGSGIAIGGAVIVFAAWLSGARVGILARPLAITAILMLTVGLLACLEPARRALRIQPVEALKEM